MAQIACIKDYQTGPAQLRIELRRVDQALEQLMAELLELHAACESEDGLGDAKEEIETVLKDAQKALQELKQATTAYEQSPATKKARDLR